MDYFCISKTNSSSTIFVTITCLICKIKVFLVTLLRNEYNSYFDKKIVTLSITFFNEDFDLNLK